MSPGEDSFQGPAPDAWLLEGPAFVRYRTLVDVLGRSDEDEEVQQARAAVPFDPAVEHLLGQRNDQGYWGAPDDIFKWWPKKDTTFWVLGVLADFGLGRGDGGIRRACEYVLGTQLPCGAFGLRPPPTPYDCYTGVLVAALARLGYLDDRRLERAYSWLAGRQRNDGGFWCKSTGQPGGPREHEPSCALASLWVLSALTAHPAFRESGACRRCATFLLGCWDNRGRIKYAGHDSQVGSGWERLKYPFTDYRVLHYLEVLSRVPFLRADARLAEIAELLMSRRDGEGRFRPESIHKAWSRFDFGQKREPSMWLTCLAYGAVARLDRPG
ncbi:MAG: prenyltransferase/squalene oxidase repeat-containing protein [Planctomycetota bacterium]